MKKVILLVAVAMMAVTGVNAQSEIKQEIAVSYGTLSNSDWLNIFESVIGAVFGETYEEGSYVGPIGMEYFYHVKPWCGVGAIATYGHLIQDSSKDDNKVGTKTDRYTTLMPAVKFDWLRREAVSLYSKLGAGVTWRQEKREFEGDNAQYNSDKTEAHFNWQVSLLGVEAGKRLRGFAELGFGEQGLFIAGVRYRF